MVAGLANLPGPVGLAGLVDPWRQPEVRADDLGRWKPAWGIDGGAEHDTGDRANTGDVIRRRQTSSPLAA